MKTRQPILSSVLCTLLLISREVYCQEDSVLLPEELESSDYPYSEDELSAPSFPVPVIENVYKAWKPVNHGHPLRDATLFYAPPSLERVQIGARAPPEPDVFSYSPNSRGDLDYFESEGRNLPDEEPDQHNYVVIAATPKVKNAQVNYSVYGSPDINYSQLYDLPVSIQPKFTRKGLKRKFWGKFQSAHESRSADDVPNEQQDEADVPPLRLKPEYLFGSKYKALQQQQARKDISDHPRRVYSRDYHYYSDPSLAEALSGHHQPPSPYSHYEDAPPAAEPEPQQAQARRDDSPDLELAASYQEYSHHVHEDQEPTVSVQQPPAQIPESNPEAVVYSFTNQYGQKQKVGVVYENAAESQVSQVFSSNKPEGVVPFAGARVKPIPLVPPVDAPQPSQPSSNVPRTEKQEYPLGRPFAGAKYEARPKFFAPHKHPPIFRIRPQKLEGVFGPPLPSKPEPQRIIFSASENPNYADELSSRPSQKSGVYKTVRDMDYVRPPVILRVRDSGELYEPDNEPGAGYRHPVAPQRPHPRQRQLFDSSAAERRSDDHQFHYDTAQKPWLPNFSDTYKDQPSQQQLSIPKPPASHPIHLVEDPLGLQLHQGDVSVDEDSQHNQQKRSPLKASSPSTITFEDAEPPSVKQSSSSSKFLFPEPVSLVKSKKKPIRSPVNTRTQQPAANTNDGKSGDYVIVVGARYDK